MDDVLTAADREASLTDLSGRAALITGGGRGIGAAAAVALARAGARVAVASRNEAQVVEVAAHLRGEGLEGFAFRCDVTDPHQVRDLALSASEAMGQVDILVNNASTATSNRLGRITMTEWDHIMAVNVTGTFLCTRAVFDGMTGRGWGRVVNVSSLAGLDGNRYIAAFVAAEHAVIGFTKAVAAEAEGTGVTVNAVCPGYVDMPLTDETIGRIMALTGLSRAEALQAVLAEAGQPRLIRATEVADAIVELCRDDGRRNGEAVVLDGRSPGQGVGG